MTAWKGRAQPGDVIRLYKLRANVPHLRAEGGLASAEHPAWFVVRAVYDDQIYADVLVMTHPNKGLGTHKRWHTRWTIANNHQRRRELGDGHYHVVRPERWPDEISAAFMLYQLKGDEYEP